MRRVVFLSSTGKDLHAYREAVIAHLAKLDHFTCDAMESFGARDASSVPFCRERVRAADIYVGLIGHYRGWEPAGDGTRRSITEMEYDWACEHPVKPRLIYISPDDFALPGPAPNKGEARRQKAFRKRLMSAHIVDQTHFETPEALAGAVVRGLVNHVMGELLRARARGEQSEADHREDPFKAAADAAEQAAADENIDPAVLAQSGVDVEEIEARLAARAAMHEAKGREEHRISAHYYRQIGALAFLHDTQKALDAYIRTTELNPDDPEGWNRLGQLQVRTGQLDAATFSFNQVLKLGEQHNDDELIVTAAGNLGIIHRIRGDLDQAEEIYKMSLALEKNLGRKEGMAADYGNLGNVYRARGDLDQAELMYRMALFLEDELGRKEDMAATYGNLGNTCAARGDLEQAEEMYCRALVLAEADVRKDIMAVQYANLGNIHLTRGDPDKAEVMYRKALAINEALNRKEGMAANYGNLGTLYRTLSNFDEAEAMYLKALVLEEMLGRRKNIAAIFGSLGNIYGICGDLDRAERMFRKALTLNETLTQEVDIAANHLALGILYWQKKDVTQACAHWLRAHNLYARTGVRPMMEKVEGFMRKAGCPAA